jgi:hypothetical protein
MAPDEAVWWKVHHLDTNPGVVTGQRPDTEAGAELPDGNRDLFIESEAPHKSCLIGAQRASGGRTCP